LKKNILSLQKQGYNKLYKRISYNI